MAIPVPFSDIAKPANDLLNKDFYHTTAANLEIKSKAPNGVVFNVKGKSAHDGPISGSLEGKYADKASGVTLTQTWTTANSLDTKLELDDSITQGLKAEVLSNYLPAKQTFGGKVNLFYKQPSIHTRLFTDVFKGPTVSLDTVIGHEGFLVGGEAGYDVSKAAITRYALAVGYSQPTYAAAVTASNNLSLFSASYYHKVNTEVEAGAKATWDSAQNSNVGLEVATKYKLDPSSFAKASKHSSAPRFSVQTSQYLPTLPTLTLWPLFTDMSSRAIQAKINDRGIAALAYNVKLGTGSTLGLGASFDTQNLNQAAHKVGASFTFEG